MAKGLCKVHYYRLKNTGSVEPSHYHEKKARAECSIAECERPTLARRLCQMHYYRLMRGGEVGEAGTRRPGAKRKHPLVCVVDECGRHSDRGGFCSMHYARLKKRGDVGSPDPERPQPVGWHHKDGYLIVSAPGRKRQILAHRLVMSEHIGRELLPHENVHHINGDRLDNRIENLELWSTRQPKGQRAKDKLAWAREIISLYQPLEDAGLI